MQREAEFKTEELKAERRELVQQTALTALQQENFLRDIFPDVQMPYAWYVGSLREQLNQLRQQLIDYAPEPADKKAVRVRETEQLRVAAFVKR